MGLHMRRGALPLGVLLVALAAPASAAVVTGTNGPDTLVGTPHADTIRGYKGADTLYGLAGADTLYAGQDRARDHVYGGRGPDRIHMTTMDWVYGGPGDDRFFFKPAFGTRRQTRIYCGPGNDTVVRLDGYGSAWMSGCEHVVKARR